MPVIYNLVAHFIHSADVLMVKYCYVMMFSCYFVLCLSHCGLGAPVGVTGVGDPPTPVEFQCFHISQSCHSEAHSCCSLLGSFRYQNVNFHRSRA